ncbi:hypothetical protein RIF29_30142 [Crotalaria pallida]|uniref:Thioesterase domain-containing protein n=1 Tax=Crotalaria pallida TaxID=3830 RepID=A0AAN9EG47_CROPI
MAVKPSTHSQTQTPPSFSNKIDPLHASHTLDFFRKMGMAQPVPQSCNVTGSFSSLFRSFIKVDHIQRGRISCTVAVKPPTCNAYGTLHGGSVGSYAEILSIACARTIVAENKELFLGEISVSYLSAAPNNSEVLADVSVMKSGRNVTVVALEFKLKKTGTLIYIAHATFYNMPVAKL